MKLSTLVCAGMVSALCVTSASAALIVTEDFEYGTTGNTQIRVVGTNGTGWVTGWAGAAGAYADDGEMRMVSGQNARRNMGTVAGGHTADGKELWVSYSGSISGTGGMRISAFGIDGTLVNQGTQMRIEADGRIHFLNAGADVATTATGIVTLDQDFTILLRHDFNGAGTDVVSVWFDADWGTFDGTQTATLSYTGDINTDGDFISMRNSSGMTSYYDDLTSGDNYTSVIPEPATLGLIAFAGASLLFIRRFMAI